MTRREKLIASTGLTLIQIADNLGIKVNCNKTRTQLKEAKSVVVERILEAEQEKGVKASPVLTDEEIEDLKKEFTEEEIGEIMELIGKGYSADDAIEEVSLRHPCVEDIEDQTPAELEETENPITTGNTPAETPKKKRRRKSKDSAPTTAPGRGAQIEYNGKSQNICAWAKELGISANTLYARIYHSGWSVEEAFTTPSKGRGRKK